MKARHSESDAEEHLYSMAQRAFANTNAGGSIKPQHRFHPDRNWRFDFAFPEFMIGVEVDGQFSKNKAGKWMAISAHTSIKGYAADRVRDCEAFVHGWSVFRFTTTLAIEETTWCLHVLAQALKVELPNQYRWTAPAKERASK